MSVLTRVCIQCVTRQPLHEYHKNKTAHGGHIPRCRTCVNKNARSVYATYYGDTKRKRHEDWKKQNPEKMKAAAKKSRLKKIYGLTQDAWDAMFAGQGNVCAICRATHPGGGKDVWHTDHDHSTGKVRGILCTGCNLALGIIKDDAARARGLADYLESSHG